MAHINKPPADTLCSWPWMAWDGIKGVSQLKVVGLYELQKLRYVL